MLGFSRNNMNNTTGMHQDRGLFKVDIQQNYREYLIQADLPGVDEQEIHLNMQDGRFSIYVDRLYTDGNNRDFIQKERNNNSMSRSFYFSDANQSGIESNLKNGVLTVNILRERRY